jgi:hypothetical protein
MKAALGYGALRAARNDKRLLGNRTKRAAEKDAEKKD